MYKDKRDRIRVYGLQETSKGLQIAELVIVNSNVSVRKAVISNERGEVLTVILPKYCLKRDMPEAYTEVLLEIN